VPTPITTPEPERQRAPALDADRAARLTGLVQRLYLDRGFGFIRVDRDQDYFFHRSGLDAGLLMSDLQEGLRVTFEPRQVPKGLRAEHIQIAA